MRSLGWCRVGRAVVVTALVMSVVAMSTPVASAAAATSGFLRVTTLPAVPSQISIDGTVADTWGLQWLEIAPGSHQVCFSDVAGYTTPACQNVTVTAGATSTVVGAFTQMGRLQVRTSPPSPSQISVDGIPRDDWGLDTDIAPGSHQVCFGAAAGLSVPACQNVTITAGATSTVTGTFTTSQGTAGLTNVGLLRVTTSPPVTSQISVDGQVADTRGLNWLEIVPGSHQVCFTTVPGYLAAPCQTVQVTVGATTTVTGAFTATGLLHVVTSPPVASQISVDGIPRDDWGLDTDMPVGSHQVCFGAVAGSATPPCQTVNVTAGATSMVTETFTPTKTVTWTALTPPMGPEPWEPAAVNDSGLVVGHSAPNGVAGDFGYCTGACVTINPLVQPTGYTTVTLAGVSSSGEIVGFGTDAKGDHQGLVWPFASATPTVLVGESVDQWWDTTSVSPSGAIVGYGRDETDMHGLVWPSASALPTEVAQPAGYHGIAVVQESGSGVLIGSGDDTSGKQQGLVWASASAQPTILAQPAGVSPTDVSPTDVSESGTIVGFEPTGLNLGLVWASESAQPTILALPAGYTTAQTSGVTESGMIVGYGTDTNGNTQGLVWSSASAQPTILAQPVGETHVQVSGVTATGIMYGSGTDMLGVTQVLTWSSSTAHPTIIDPPTGATAKQVQAVGAGGTIVISATNSSGVVSSFVAKP